MNKCRKIFAFTLIELVIVIAIISILASIVVIFINPSSIYSTTRNTSRTQDLNSLRITLERYFIDAGGNGQVATFSALNGYSAMVSNATSAGGATSICPNATNFSSVVNPFSIQKGTGATTLSVDNLINGGYLPNALTDPTGNAYKACIDPCHNQQLVIYSDVVEAGSSNISVPLGTLGASTTGTISYPCLVQSASASMKSLAYPYCLGNNITVTLSSAPIVGDLLVVSAWNYDSAFYNNGTIATVNDNMSNGNYTQSANNGGNSSGAVNTWYKKITNTGSNFTITGIPLYVNAQNCSLIAVQEYKGLTSGTLDQASSAGVGVGFGFCNGTQSSGSTSTTTQAVELLVGATYLTKGGGNSLAGLVITPGAGYTLRESPTTGQEIIFTQDKVVSTTGAYNSTYTVNIADCGHQDLVSTFK